MSRHSIPTTCHRPAPHRTLTLLEVSESSNNWSERSWEHLLASSWALKDRGALCSVPQSHSCHIAIDHTCRHARSSPRQTRGHLGLVSVSLDLVWGLAPCRCSISVCRLDDLTARFCARGQSVLGNEPWLFIPAPSWGPPLPRGD